MSKVFCVFAMLPLRNTVCTDVHIYVCMNAWSICISTCIFNGYVHAYAFKGVKRLKKFQEEFAELEKERQELVNAEKLFDLPITLYSDLIAVDNNLQGMAKVFELYEAQRVVQ